MNGYIKNVK